MHYFTIRDVENLSGIKAHTLRIWEQRYGLCVCKRKESQHRYYDNEDLKYILRIAWLYHNGYRISRIATFSPEEITHLAAQPFINDEYDVLVNQLVEAGLEYNQPQFEKSLNNAMKSMGLETCIVKVVHPFLAKIGLLWMTNHVMPAQEHFCSHLIQRMIITAIQTLPPALTNSGKLFLLFTPPLEMHDLPLLLAQYILKKQGYKTCLLGTNMSADMLQYCCSHQPVTHLYFNFITNLTNVNAAEYLDKLAETFSHLQIIASGAALKDVEHIPSNVTILRSLQDMMDFQPA